jgi:hypothetical protein
MRRCGCRCLQEKKGGGGFGIRCKEEVARYEQRAAGDYRVNFRLKKGCEADVKALCKDTCRVEEGQVLPPSPCLLTVSGRRLGAWSEFICAHWCLPCVLDGLSMLRVHHVARMPLQVRAYEAVVLDTFVHLPPEHLP